MTAMTQGQMLIHVEQSQKSDHEGFCYELEFYELIVDSRNSKEYLT